MAAYPIPIEALDDRFGVLGTPGSGKTYFTLGVMAQLLKAKHRAVGVDPMGVMWGLRLDQDGKTPSPFKVVIFGGKHGDLPLTEGAGAVIGEAVATMAESCIIDTSELPTNTAERRFMVAFTEAIFRATDPDKVDPYHLIIDEADRFAPQKPQAGDEILLNRIGEIVRRGRVRGFIPWLVTQRPAVLNKDVLSMVDSMVIMKLVSATDRDQIRGWVDTHADPEAWREMRAQFPTLQQGQGVLWLPSRGRLETVTFPANTTFDSSASPKRGQRRVTKELKPLDVGALKARLAKVDEEIRANDPKTLKAEIAQLRIQLAKKPAAKAAEPVDPRAIEQADARGFSRGRAKGYVEGLAAARVAYGPALALLQPVAEAVGDLRIELKKVDAWELRQARAAAPKPAWSGAVVAPSSGAPTVSAPAIALRQQRERPEIPTSADGLTAPQRAVLASLAWWASLGRLEPTRGQVAVIAGWVPNGSNIRDRLSELSRAGLVARPQAGLVSLTDEGRAIAPEPPASEGLTQALRAVLSTGQCKVFDALKTLPSPAARDEIAAMVGWEPGGSNIRDRLSELARLDVIERPSPGMVQLKGWVTA